VSRTAEGHRPDVGCSRDPLHRSVADVEHSRRHRAAPHALGDEPSCELAHGSTRLGLPIGFASTEFCLDHAWLGLGFWIFFESKFALTKPLAPNLRRMIALSPLEAPLMPDLPAPASRAETKAEVAVSMTLLPKRQSGVDVRVLPKGICEKNHPSLRASRCVVPRLLAGQDGLLLIAADKNRLGKRSDLRLRVAARFSRISMQPCRSMPSSLQSPAASAGRPA
jgi:hypothetical protein